MWTGQNEDSTTILGLKTRGRSLLVSTQMLRVTATCPTVPTLTCALLNP